MRPVLAGLHPADLSLAEAGAALRRGALTSAGLVRSHIERIEARDPAIGAFTFLAKDEALAAAEAADAELAAGRDRGPLHGLPFAVKDIIDVAGWPIRHGSRAQAGRIAVKDAEVIRVMRAAGAVPLGVVTTYEMATVGPDETALAPFPVNPWNARHITGGSSSGSAAAVAAGMIRLALGTDTGGSVRSPASYCGAVGLKPGRGVISAEGVMALSESLDHIGLITRSADDAALGFGALTGEAPQPADITGLRLAYWRGWAMGDEADPALLPLLDAAASALSLLGARIEISAPPDYHPAETAGCDLLLAEAYEALGAEVEAAAELIGAKARASILSGRTVTAQSRAAAKDAAAALCKKVDAALEGRDAIILPTTMTPAPPFSAFESGEPVWTAMRTIPFNMTGHPAVSVPMGFILGLPMGLQIVGARGAEQKILRIAAAFEAATDHSALQPALA